MTARMALGSIVMMFILVLTGYAGGREELRKYFSDTAMRVKETDDPSRKREILDESFQRMTGALNMVGNPEWVSPLDLAGLDHFKASIREKQDELAGRNGYEQVRDEQLNDFSDYVVQDTEQADQMITISVVTLLLIIILIVLIVK